jgi:signal transduction histidine kinase
MHKTIDEIRLQFGARIYGDTNVGIDVFSSSKKLRQLAADIDWQLKILRKRHLRYIQGDNELKNIVTSFSHDLRTPLTAICGYIDLLQKEDTSDSVRRYLDIIADRAEALKTLTDEMFKYSVLMESYIIDSCEEVSLTNILEESIAIYYGAIKNKGITVKIDIPANQIVRKLNSTALYRIFGNIINNAIKYSDGDLSISLSENGAISFCNSTSDIDEITVGKLFNRFYTVENGKESTGVGLYIAKELTEQMGGRISAAIKDNYFTVKLEFD